MMPTFASHLDALGQWRADTDARLASLARFAREHDLLDDASAEWFEAMRHRLSGEKLMVAFVAEFSRGKSELINAIFFSDKGRRMMPASAGRTTMCPVELGYDAEDPVGLSLLPIETRLEPTSLTEYRARRSAWTWIELDLQNPDGMAQALAQVVRTRLVSKDEAARLGFWDDERPDDNPPLQAEDLVEVPVWRHARINLPHPLLKRGLVVLDTPGLNAIGTEPELTLGLLPQAHATVFILGADTGVTRSDLSIWRDHLSGPALARYVALNKIDTLVDPLSTPAEVEAVIARQRESVAQTLEIPAAHVFPISARLALTSRLSGDASGMAASRLEAFEHALSDGLLPRRRDNLAEASVAGALRFQQQLQRRFGEMRRLYADQLLELRGLRGKSSGKVQLMLQRVQAEATEFEQCTARLQAMRSVHARMMKDVLRELSSDRLRAEVEVLQQVLGGSWLPLGARKAFIELCARLRGLIEQAQQRNDEVHAMLVASFAKLNAEFGFSLVADKPVDVRKYTDDLNLIERNYVQYLGLSQAFRLAQPGFQEQFRRMLISRLRVVFETVSNDIELWNKTASAQVDSQLRERRRNFKRRYESLDRIQTASTELDNRLQEVQAQDERVLQLQTRLGVLVDELVQQAQSAGGLSAAAGLPGLNLDLNLSTEPALLADSAPSTNA
ncbi:dynamin family protein [uncultured Aquabacterium sp.]|jgi:methyl-accepting chemotaxis protein|uniref:dynamin family protein n=1 Tax=uncultured Aquabacterium sp. TaxID=158753 RepID=UPI00263909FF|nr:dynamin family protein [uncultured Aquabacterium sp.]